MQYFIEKPKQVFSYTTGDGKQHYNTDIEYINELGLDEESKSSLLRSIARFNTELEFFEKRWRDRRLTESDWCMVEDAEIKGEEIRSSEKYTEIKEYRKALRRYNPITEDRPIKPNWLK